MASKYNKGDIALFAGYGDDAKSDSNFSPILEAGQRVKIDSVSDEGSLIVFAIDDEGNTITDDAGNPVADTVFPEEMGELEGEEAGEEAGEETTEETPAETAPAEAAAPKRTAGKGKAAAAPKEKAPTKAEVKAQEKAEKEAAKQQAAADKEAAKQKAAADKEAAAKEKEEAKAKREADKKAREEAKAAKPDNDDPLMIRVEETKSVTEILKSEKSALDAAKLLVNRSEQTDFTLGGVLHNIYVTGAFKTLGYDGKRGFSDYVERELGVQYRKARYLISIYTTFAQVFRAKGITEDDLLKLGWSKAKELARIPVNQLVDNYDSLIAMASDGETSRDELIKHISENFEVTQRKETVKAIDFRFRLVSDEAEMAKGALDQAKKLAGDNADDNKAFAYIVGDWLNTAESQNTMTLQSLIDLAQAQFGVTLVQSDAATSEAGEEAAEQA